MEQVPLEELIKKDYIFYYSTKSKPSMKLKDMITNSKIEYLFELINIDNPASLQHNIRSVPSIIYQDMAYSGKDAFDYIQNMKKKDINSFDSFSSNYSTSFSCLDNENMQHSFFDLNEGEDVSIQSEDYLQQDETKSLINNLIEQRNNDIPKPIQRV